MVEKHIITQSSCFINICLSDTYQDSIQKDKKKIYVYYVSGPKIVKW